MGGEEIITNISLSYAEGRFFDLWMVVHVLAGVEIALIAIFTKISQKSAYIYAAAVLVLWEVGEILLNIQEAPSNRGIDVIVGIVGFALVFEFLKDEENKLTSGRIVIATLALLATSLVGWLAYHQR